MRDGILIMFVVMIIVVLLSLAIFVGLAIVALHPEISLWYRIPAFIFDIAIACFAGYLICIIKHNL